jgi:hypothetical protein
MRNAVGGKILLEHVERDLGEYTGAKGMAGPESELGFSLLQFEDRPESDVTATITLGLSAHVLRGRDGGDRREELIVLLRQEFDEAALQLAANIGSYVLEEHIALIEGETASMPKQPGSVLDRLAVARPEPFSARLARCDSFDPPVEFVWLLPFASSEHHIVAEHGWSDLLHWIRNGSQDPYDLGRNVVL